MISPNPPLKTGPARAGYPGSCPAGFCLQEQRPCNLYKEPVQCSATLTALSLCSDQVSSVSICAYWLFFYNWAGITEKSLALTSLCPAIKYS